MAARDSVHPYVARFGSVIRVFNQNQIDYMIKDTPMRRLTTADDRTRWLSRFRDRWSAQIGVWSENSLDRTVVAAVYGQPA
jgi:hypothetical protein